MQEEDGARSLRALLEPSSIAIVGASRTVGKSGNSAVRNLLGGKFGGRIYPINPSATEIEGLTCYPSIAALPEPPDCAMLVIPAGEMVKAARECGEAGTRSLIIAASGFAETGEADDIRRQDELRQIAKECGLRMLGPNTNGILNTAQRLQLGYNSEYREFIAPGSISIISHSGALFSGIVRSLRKLGAGLCKFVPVGNEADVDMLDLLEFMIHDDATRVIGLVMEGVSDGPRLRHLAICAQQTGKPIVALKVGRSSVGVEAALAHSSRLAGSSRAYDALFDSCRIAAVRSVEALAGGCALLSTRPPRSMTGDQRLICVSTSGAGGALLADFADEHGLRFAGDSTGEWQGPAAEKIGAMPARGRIRNPVDLGSLDADWKLLADVYDALEADGLDGPTAAFAHVAVRPIMDKSLKDALIARKSRTGKPIVLVVPGGLTEELEDSYRESGIPIFYDMATAFDSLQCHFSTLPLNITQSVSRECDFTQGAEAAASMLDAWRDSNPDAVTLSEWDSSNVLREAGLLIVPSCSVTSLEDALAAASRVGYPVVCKALVPNVAHKNAMGLVIARIPNADGLAAAFEAITQRVRDLGHSSSEVPFILQKMVASELEVIVGVSYEAGLGHFLIAGLGGIYAEVLDEAVLLPVPSTPAEIHGKIANSRLGKILNSLKSSRELLAQVVDALDVLQSLITAAGDRIESIDVNPFLIGETCMAVDALIVPRRQNDG